MRHLLSACSMFVLAAALCGCPSMGYMAAVSRPDVRDRPPTLASGAFSGISASRDPGTGAAVLLPRGAATPWGDPSLAPHMGGAPRTPITFREGGGRPSPVPQRPNLSVDLQRQIIYTGRFAVDVPDVEEAVKTAARAAGELGGYVQKQTNNTIILRVPAAKFHEAVGRVEQLGVVREKSIDAQDVTEKYMDLKLRLGARTAYLDQLKKMLAGAKDMKIMLEIQRELSKTVEEIERLKGKLRYLTSQVRLSTIAIDFGKLHGRGGRSFKLPFRWLDGLGLVQLLP